MAFVPKVARRTFTKCVTVVAALLRKQSLRLAVYLDNWLNLNALKISILRDGQKLLSILIELGFMINPSVCQGTYETYSTVSFYFWKPSSRDLPNPSKIAISETPRQHGVQLQQTFLRAKLFNSHWPKSI